MSFVEAVVKATGRKQTVPAHWLDHPTIGGQFRLTAREKKRADKPTEATEDTPEKG